MVKEKFFFKKFLQKKWNIGTNDYYCCISMFLDEKDTGTSWYKVVQSKPNARTWFWLFCL